MLQVSQISSEKVPFVDDAAPLQRTQSPELEIKNRHRLQFVHPPAVLKRPARAVGRLGIADQRQQFNATLDRASQRIENM